MEIKHLEQIFEYITAQNIEVYNFVSLHQYYGNRKDDTAPQLEDVYTSLYGRGVAPHSRGNAVLTNGYVHTRLSKHFWNVIRLGLKKMRVDGLAAKRMAYVFALIFVLLLPACDVGGTAGTKAAEEWSNNPIIEQRADPWVMKHSDGYYYFTGSVPEYDRIVLRRAQSIEGLTDADEVTIWKAHEAGEMSQHIWAPELHEIDGKWYIYFAAGQKEDIWKIRPYILESESSNPLEGEWIEKGIARTSDQGSRAFTDFSLDMTTFEHKGGRYAVWAEKRNGISNLYIDKMVNPWTIEGNESMISTPEHAWEKIGFWVNEGAAILKRNGKIFMTFSASATDDNYAIGLLSASEDSDLKNPASWSKSELPVMRSDEGAGQYGTGHNSFTVSDNGKHDVIVYHARPYKEIHGDPLYDPNRHTHAQVLYWNEDGTPRFGATEVNQN